MKSFQLETKEEKVERQKTSSWSWKMNEDDLKNQIENYDKLKITESYRGISVLLGLFSIVLTLIMMSLGLADSSALFDLIALAVVLFFVYKGHKWAIIALMIIWTVEKAVQVYSISQNGGSPVVAIIWWFIFMPYFWKALKVEIARKKTIGSPAVQGKKSFCNECGTPVNVGAKFCVKCGNKI